MKYLYLMMAVLVSVACQSQDSKEMQVKMPGTSTFNNYWYAGEAELNSYDLKQMRYGEIHEGEVVLVFVTEDFSVKKQVKLDNPQAAGKDATSVLNLNQIKEFNTGVYSYNMMNSVFTPVNGEKTIKVSTSSQDWCGHSFDQLNLKENSYTHSKRSYFESEGDTENDIPAKFLEDAIFNQIRLNPIKLPQGKVNMIPATFFSRLRHIPLKQELANAQLMKNSDNTLTYKVNYENIERKLTITFEDKFPFKILTWEERHRTGFGPNAKMLSTKATLKKTLKSPYWKKHGVRDRQLRDKLELRF